MSKISTGMAVLGGLALVAAACTGFGLFAVPAFLSAIGAAFGLTGATAAVAGTAAVGGGALTVATAMDATEAKVRQGWAVDVAKAGNPKAFESHAARISAESANKAAGGVGGGGSGAGGAPTR